MSDYFLETGRNWLYYWGLLNFNDEFTLNHNGACIYLCKYNSININTSICTVWMVVQWHFTILGFSGWLRIIKLLNLHHHMLLISITRDSLIKTARLMTGLFAWMSLIALSRTHFFMYTNKATDKWLKWPMTNYKMPRRNLKSSLWKTILPNKDIYIQKNSIFFRLINISLVTY